MDDFRITLSSLLSTQKYGMKVSRIPHEYYDITEETFPYRELGYATPEELLRNTPGFILYRDGNGDMYAKAMATEKTSHLHELIAKQRSPSKKKPSRSLSNHAFSGRRMGFNTLRSSSTGYKPNYSSSSKSQSRPAYDRSRSSGDYRSQSRSSSSSSGSRTTPSRPQSSSSSRQLSVLNETPSRPITIYEPESSKKASPPTSRAGLVNNPSRPITVYEPENSRRSDPTTERPSSRTSVSSRAGLVETPSRPITVYEPESSRKSDPTIERPSSRTSVSSRSSATRTDAPASSKNGFTAQNFTTITDSSGSQVEAQQQQRLSISFRNQTPLTLSASNPIFNRAMKALNSQQNQTITTTTAATKPPVSVPAPVLAPAPVPVPASTPQYTKSLSERLNIMRIGESQKSPPAPPTPVVNAPAKPQDPRAKLKLLAAKHNLPEPRYRTCSGKPPKVYSQLEIGTDYVFKSYPQDANSEEEAQIIAAGKALVEIESKFGAQTGLPITQDVRIIGVRVFNIICEHESGVFEERIPLFYEEQHHEILPNDWNKVLEHLDVRIDVGVGKRIITKKGPESTVPMIKRSQSSPAHVLSGLPAQKLPEQNLWPALISSVSSTTEVWGRFLDENDDFKDPIISLAEEMKAHYSKSNHPARIIERSSYYAIKSDDSWHRVRVEDVDILTRRALIFYIDIGDEETVDFSSLHPLAGRFLTEAPMAIKMLINSLEDMYCCDKVTEIAEELMLDKGLYIEVLHREEKKKYNIVSGVFWDTTSQEDDVNINQEIKNKMVDYCQQSLFREKKELQVQLRNIDDNGDIYLQAITEILEIINIMIATIVNSGRLEASTNNGLIDQKLMYLVKDPNGEWVRAKVIQIIDFDTFKVLTIDYGKTFEVTTEKLRCLNDLNDSLVKFPAQASIVKLDGIKKLDENMKKRLNELAPTNDTMTCKIIDNKIIPVVDLITRNPKDNILFSINLNLLAMNEADNNNNVKTKKRVVDRSLSRSGNLQKLRPPFIPAVNKYFEVCVGKNCSNPNNFVVQPYESKEELKTMMEELNEVCEANTLSPMAIEKLQVGKLYAAKADDGLWYRACLYRIQPDKTLIVYHYDYGGIHLASVQNIQPLSPEFYQLPYQAIRAELVGIKPKEKDWDFDTCLRFRELVVDKYLYSQIKYIKNDEKDNRIEIGITLIDTTQDEDVHIHDVLVNENKAEYADI